MMRPSMRSYQPEKQNLLPISPVLSQTSLAKRQAEMRLRISRYCPVHRRMKQPVSPISKRSYHYCRSCIVERMKEYHLGALRKKEMKELIDNSVYRWGSTLGEPA
jgi:hypothetical protein